MTIAASTTTATPCPIVKDESAAALEIVPCEETKSDELKLSYNTANDHVFSSGKRTVFSCWRGCGLIISPMALVLIAVAVVRKGELIVSHSTSASSASEFLRPNDADGNSRMPVKAGDDIRRELAGIDGDSNGGTIAADDLASGRALETITYTFELVGQGICSSACPSSPGGNQYWQYDYVAYSNIATKEACKQKCEACPGQNQGGLKLVGVTFLDLCSSCLCNVENMGSDFNFSPGCTDAVGSFFGDHGSGPVTGFYDPTQEFQCFKVVGYSDPAICSSPAPTEAPTTEAPTTAPTTGQPTSSPTTSAPTVIGGKTARSKRAKSSKADAVVGATLIASEMRSSGAFASISIYYATLTVAWVLGILGH